MAIVEVVLYMHKLFIVPGRYIATGLYSEVVVNIIIFCMASTVYTLLVGFFFFRLSCNCVV